MTQTAVGRKSWCRMSRRDFETTVLVRGEESRRARRARREHVPAGWAGPPLHHHDFDETFYVLEGELTFALGYGRRSRAARRAGVRAPWRPAHARRAGAARARGTCSSSRRAASSATSTASPPSRPAPSRRHSALGPIPETIVVGPPIGEARRRGVRPVAPARARQRLLRGARQRGRVAVMDNTVGADANGPPLHHHDFDEAFYVIDGELTFQLGDERRSPARPRRARVRAARGPPRVRQPERRGGAHAARLHAGGLRALLRPHRRARGRASSRRPRRSSRGPRS